MAQIKELMIMVVQSKTVDDYGGSIQNRVRLTLEVTKAVTEIWGGVIVSEYAFHPQGPLTPCQIATLNIYTITS